MSPASLEEVVRQIYDGWSRGDFSAGTDLYDANVVLVLRPEFPESGVYTGTDAVRTYMRSLLDSWKLFTITAEGLEQVGDSVLVRVAQRGTGITSGAESEMRYFQLWSFRGGKVIRIESIAGADEAREAAGLPQ